MAPLDNLPLNTRKSYVMAKTWNGCEVYIPVDSDDMDELKAKKMELQTYLNAQCPEQPEPEPRYA